MIYKQYIRAIVKNICYRETTRKCRFLNPNARGDADGIEITGSTLSFLCLNPFLNQKVNIKVTITDSTSRHMP